MIPAALLWSYFVLSCGGSYLLVELQEDNAIYEITRLRNEIKIIKETQINRLPQISSRSFGSGGRNLGTWSIIPLLSMLFLYLILEIYTKVLFIFVIEGDQVGKTINELETRANKLCQILDCKAPKAADLCPDKCDKHHSKNGMLL